MNSTTKECLIRDLEGLMAAFDDKVIAGPTRGCLKDVPGFMRGHCDGGSLLNPPRPPAAAKGALQLQLVAQLVEPDGLLLVASRRLVADGPQGGYAGRVDGLDVADEAQLR